jgi:hypothetical protein
MNVDPTSRVRDLPTQIRSPVSLLQRFSSAARKAARCDSQHPAA